MKSVLIPVLKLLICACLAALLAASCQRPASEEEKQPGSIAGLLPAVQELPGGWKLADTAGVFTGAGLYEYINGGADLYHEYGFVEVAVQEYVTPDGITVFLNIYRMSDPAAAFGIFSVTRRDEYQPVAIGTAGARADYQQIFCHGRYYVEAQAMDTDSLTAGAMDDLCRAVDSNLESEPARLPQALDILNERDVQPHSSVLVRGPLGLNTRKYLSDENIFCLSDSVPGVLVSGRVSADRPQPETIFVVNYPDSAFAQRVFSGLRVFYKGRAGDILKGGRLEAGDTRLLFAAGSVVVRINREGNVIQAAFGLTSPGKDK